jgi:hypothetical protein
MPRDLLAEVFRRLTRFSHVNSGTLPQIMSPPLPHRGSIQYYPTGPTVALSVYCLSYGLDDVGIESRHVQETFLVSITSILALAPTQLPI